MPSFRSFSLWFLRLICLTALSGLVYLAMISTTILDRSDVKQWLNASGLYANNTLVSAIFSPQPTNTQIGDIPTVEQSFISSEAIKNAAARTFTDSYLQTSFEHVIDQSYNWIEGQGTEFSFSIPIQTKRDVFISELVKEVEPRIAALPLCTLQSRTICRPNMPVSQFAQQIVTDSISQSDFLQTPITEASFAPATSNQEIETLSQLPRLRSIITTLLWIFPIIFILSLGALWLLAPHGNKLRTFIKLSRGAFSSMLLTTILSGIVIVIERTNGFPLESILPPAGELTPIFAAFVNQLILGMAWGLLLFAGTVLILSTLSWITLSQLKKRLSSRLSISSLPPPAPTPPLSSL